PAYGGDDFVLQSSTPLEIALVFGKLDQQVAHECAHRSVALRRFDPRPPIDVIGKRYCEILHNFTVSQTSDRWGTPLSFGRRCLTTPSPGASRTSACSTSPSASPLLTTIRCSGFRRGGPGGT